MISLILSVCLSFPAAQQIAPHSSLPEAEPDIGAELERAGCKASNARDNSSSTPLMGGPGAYQHVQVIRGGGRAGAFHVAYSAKSNSGTSPCSKRTNNSLISVFELSPLDPSGSDFLIFGTGYGCRYLNGSPCNGAQYESQGASIDAMNVNDIVRRCMDRGGNIKVDVVVPHSHADHINPEFLHELEALNFKVQAIMTHADDLGATLGVDRSITSQCASTSSWGALMPLIQPYGNRSSVPCLQTVCTSSMQESPLTYFARAGNIWFRERGGHTPGASDLVLDAGGDPNSRFVIYGSSAPGTPASTRTGCMAPTCSVALSGVRENFSPHGNLRFAD